MACWRTAAAAFAIFVACANAQGAAPDNGDATSLEAATEDVVVAPDGSYVDTTHTEIKAVNEAGALQASRIGVFYDSEIQQVEILEAHTLKKDGSKIPVDVNSIYEQLPSDNRLAVTSFRVKVLLFPQFSAGDTAVYSVRFKTINANFAGEFTFGKYFPRGMEFKNVRIAITAPKAMKLRIETHDVAFAKADQGDTIVYTWHMTAPKTKAPPQALVSPLDHEPRLYVSSFKDYAELGAAYAAQSEPKAAVTAKVKALADQIAAGTTNRREQARLLYEWVVKQIRYVAIELGRGSFIPHDADTTITKGYGDCKDHDTLLQALLKAKGIAAQSILINAENTYTLSEAPTFTQFNHVITYVPEFDLYLDATAAAPFGTLTVEEYGKPAVRATTAGAAQITLPVLPAGLAESATVTTAKLDDKGVLTGTTKTTAKGPYSITLRYIALGIQAIGADKVVQSKLTVDGYTDITGGFTMDPPSELTPAYSVTGTFSAKGLADWLDHGEKRNLPKGLRLAGPVGDGIMGPLAPGELTDNDTTVCTSGRDSEDIAITLPPGTKPVDLPDDFTVKTANISYTAHWSFKDGTVSLHREFVSHTAQPLCAGPLRKTTAEALKKIADADGSFRLTRSLETYDSKLKENNKDIDALIQRGNAHGEKGEFDLALKDYEDALKIDPKSTWALNARGTTYYQMGKTDLAIADYTRALELAPDFEDVWYNRGLTYANLGKWDKAVADYDATLKLNPKNADALIDRGRAYAALQKYDLASADYDAAIAAAPGNWRAYSNRAALRLHNSDLQGAMADCNEALKHDAKDVWTLVLRGDIWRMKLNNEAALHDFNAALAINPKDLDALRNRAYLNVAMLRPTEAIADFDAILAQMPGDFVALSTRADAHRRLAQWDLALADYDKMIAMHPDADSGYSGKLAITVAKGQSAEAMRQAEALIAAHPGKGWPYMVRSAVRRALGDDKGANQDIALALKTDPVMAKTVPGVTITSLTKSQPKTPDYAQGIAQGLAQLSQHQYTEAALSFERAVKLGAQENSVLPLLCQALAHTARLDDAAYQCSRALTLKDGDGLLLESRGYAYFRQGKFREALTDFDQAARIYSRDARYLFERGVTKKKLGDASGDADIRKAKEMEPGVAEIVPRKMAP